MDGVNFMCENGNDIRHSCKIELQTRFVCRLVQLHIRMIRNDVQHLAKTDRKINENLCCNGSVKRCERALNLPPHPQMMKIKLNVAAIWPLQECGMNTARNTIGCGIAVIEIDINIKHVNMQ